MSVGSTMRDRDGFTLIEILITIVITSVLAVVLAQVVAGQTGRSYAPLLTINENLALEAVMNNIGADYHKLQRIDPAPLMTLESNITSENEDYWSDSRLTNGVDIELIAAGCIVFDTNHIEQSTGNANCTINDDYLKVTIGVNGTRHTLTTIFAR